MCVVVYVVDRVDLDGLDSMMELRESWSFDIPDGAKKRQFTKRHRHVKVN